MATKQEKTRYSDEELQEFKELILAKIEQAEENYKRLTDTIMVDESNPTFKMMEEGASTLQKEVSSQQAQRQLDFIRKLQAALCLLPMLALLAWYVLLAVYAVPEIMHWQYVLPAVGILAVFMARNGIVHDEKVVRAYDRIR